MWCPEMAEDFSKANPSVNSTGFIVSLLLIRPLWTLWAVGRGGRSPCFQGAFFTHLMSKIYCISGGSDRCMRKNKSRAGSPGSHCFTWIGMKYSPQVPRLLPWGSGAQHHEGTWACCAMAILQGAAGGRGSVLKEPVILFTGSLSEMPVPGEWEIHCLVEAGCWAIITYRRPPAVCCAR